MTSSNTNRRALAEQGNFAKSLSRFEAGVRVVCPLGQGTVRERVLESETVAHASTNGAEVVESGELRRLPPPGIPAQARIMPGTAPTSEICNVRNKGMIRSTAHKLSARFRRRLGDPVERDQLLDAVHGRRRIGGEHSFGNSNLAGC